MEDKKEKLPSTRIQWFPGHMTKALREIESDIKNVDLIFYCLDARAPISCLNPKLHEIAKNKKILYVLTKSDLIEKKDLDRYISYIKNNFGNVTFINSVETNSSKILYKKTLELLDEKIKAKKEKGIDLIIRAMVVGVPNVGKSTLINNFCKKAKTQTGDRPGVTKGKQWVAVDKNFLLLDTPGTLWPKFENDKVARNLAYIGSIKDNVLDLNDLAFNFIQDIIAIDKTIIENRYNIVVKENEETIDVFDAICESRGCKIKNNELDYDRCAILILDDFRKNRLGKIALDR